MKLTYRQYHYGGDFYMKGLELPEGGRIYETHMWHCGYAVKDKEDTHTPGYVIKAPSEFEDSMKIGDAWYRFMDGIYIEGSFPVEPIGNCEPPKDCYIVFEQKNMDHSIVRDPIQFLNELGELVDVDWDALRESYMEIAGIGKIRRFTECGIETSLISMKSMNSKDLVQVEIHTFNYGHTWGGGRTVHSDNFFTTEEKYKQLFNDKLDEYYKLFKE